MQIRGVIFDMDGLLIDSEPLWQIAGMAALQDFGVHLSKSQYHLSTGLRTKEWVLYWFRYFQIDKKYAAQTEERIIQNAIELIRTGGTLMPGAENILSFFRKRKLAVGLATSSPLSLVRAVIEKFDLKEQFDALSSAEHLGFGKPHPEVFLNCLQLLELSPIETICFEDSFNGLIAAKAARMRCVVVPPPEIIDAAVWGAADLKLPTLELFSEGHFQELVNSSN